MFNVVLIIFTVGSSAFTSQRSMQMHTLIL